MLHSKRGVALLIVLLVTALLIALIFEFAYATRISLNDAANFRDSQRAYFLARSGVNAFIKFNNKLEDLKNLIPQGQLQVLPMISGGDTVVKFAWEDEAGKIMISDIKTNPNTQSIVKKLMENKQVGTDVYDRMVDPASTINRMSLLSGLYEYMSEENYKKLAGCLTVVPVSRQGQKYININTASADVLQALGISAGAAQQIIEDRSQTPFTKDTMPGSVKSAMVPGLSMAAVNFLTDQSNFYKVYSEATVGGYTKRIEAIVNIANQNAAQILYWRAL